MQIEETLDQQVNLKETEDKGKIGRNIEKVTPYSIRNLTNLKINVTRHNLTFN